MFGLFVYDVNHLVNILAALEKSQEVLTASAIELIYINRVTTATTSLM